MTLDVNMPRMDGIETLRHIVEDFGIPVIIVSSLAQQDADLTLQALEIGAFDFVTKPQDAISVHITEIGEELIAKVRAAHGGIRWPGMKIVHAAADRGASRASRIRSAGARRRHPRHRHIHRRAERAELPAAAATRQISRPASSSCSTCRRGSRKCSPTRLNAACAIEVKEAQDGDLVLPGRALIAPGNRHLKIKRMPLGTIAVLSDAPPVSGHRPSADVLFRSVAAEYGGCGNGPDHDGHGRGRRRGDRRDQGAGGMTFAQDEASCVVFGMPKVAIERNHITRVLSLQEMGSSLTEHFMGREVVYGSASEDAGGAEFPMSRG